jgi:hypothetical protein
MQLRKDSWTKVGLITCLACIGVGFYIGMIRFGFSGFVMFVGFLITVWLLGLVSLFVGAKSRRQGWFTMLSINIGLLLAGACSIEWSKPYLRQSISVTFSGVQLNLAPPEEQLKAQQFADKEAHFLESLLDHF